MKDFFISSYENGLGARKIKICDSTGSDSSLPALIRLHQWDNSSNINSKPFNTNNGESFLKRTSLGYIGNSYHDFGFIINHREENSSFLWLYTKLYPDSDLKQKETIIKKNEIFEKFFVLEIPDYGAQSMSPFFTDFVPHIYIDGLKLWQKHIGMIKQYSKKTAYILIEKNNNLYKILSTDDKIDIRICFKNNIEKNYDDLYFETTHNKNDDKNENLENTIVLRLTSNDGKEFTGETSTSQFFNFGSFESEYENLFSINDFDFITDGVVYNINGTKIDTKHCHQQIHPTFIKKLIFSKIESTKDISKQNPDETNDYFKQMEIREKDGNDNFQYDRPNSKVNIELELKESLNHKECGNIRSIILVSKSNLPDAIYTNSPKLLDYNGENITKFNKSGNFNTDDDNEEYEYIPEYTSTRKLTFTGSNITKYAINTKYSHLYRWNLENAFEFGYNSDGELKNTKTIINDDGEKTESFVGYSTYFIYDSGENESIDEITEDAGSIKTVSFSTDGININHEIIRENQNYNFNYGDITYNGKNYNNTFLFTQSKLPLSFYIKFSNSNAAANKDLKMNAICRSFVIPYEVMMIDNYTLLCKIDDYFIHNDKLNYTDYNSLLNKNFLNNFEPILITSGILTPDGGEFTLYNVDGYNNYLRDEVSYYGSQKILNNNIVNFSTRNIETQ